MDNLAPVSFYTRGAKFIGLTRTMCSVYECADRLIVVGSLDRVTKEFGDNYIFTTPAGKRAEDQVTVYRTVN